MEEQERRLVLRAQQGDVTAFEMSYAEIADVTRLPLGTVKTGIHRARGLLRKALEEYEAAYA